MYIGHVQDSSVEELTEALRLAQILSPKHEPEVSSLTH